jgi:aspartyl-tRNA(Asn)/glutamyl-tRNA(Gln) amidotransferase subunit C
MAVTIDEVRHVARLARLGIPEDALAGYVQQLNGILAHMDALQRAKTDGVTVGGEAGMALREDVVGSVRIERPLAEFAPKTRGGFLLVPRLASHDGGESA